MSKRNKNYNIIRIKFYKVAIKVTENKKIPVFFSSLNRYCRYVKKKHTSKTKCVFTFNPYKRAIKQPFNFKQII